jgi:short-subunit dehydrogenase
MLAILISLQDISLQDAMDSRAPDRCEALLLYHARMDLGGRVAVITGASSGIGLACARHLASAGCPVVLGARRADRLDTAVQAIRATGRQAEALAMDVTVEEDVFRLVARAREVFGRLDIMICNAGFGYYGTVEDTPAATMQRMMDVNFMGTFHGARAALTVFREQGSGHLVIVSSIVGQRGIAQMSGYSATKAAQVGFAESLRTEFAGSGIHVSVVYPVSTHTEFREAMERDFGHSVSGLGPKQSVDHVARAVVGCLQRPRPEVYPHRMSRALAVLNAVAPGFTDTLVRKYGRRRTVT